MKQRWIKIGTLVLAAVFLVSVAVLTAWGLLHNPNGYSMYENRNLAVPETFSAETVLDGTFLQSLEPVFSDHITLRDYWLKLYTFLQMEVLQKQTVQGVVVQEDLLLPLHAPTETPDCTAAAQAMAESLLLLQNTVEDYGGTFLFVGLPEQSSALRDRYPAGFADYDNVYTSREEALFGAGEALGVQMLNLTPLFLQNQDLYYRSDHHYRLQGAYLAYQEICEALDVPALSESDFTWTALPNPFLGSLNRKLMGMWDTDEALWVYELKEPIAFERWDNGQPVEPTVFALPDRETAYTEYNAYMGGDKAETVIRTNRPELPDCLVFGDSFTNALETFLYTSFDETRSLDLRHYTEMGILEYVQTYQPDVVICMQNDTVYLLPEGNGVIE